jgi:hypothetical protein
MQPKVLLRFINTFVVFSYCFYTCLTRLHFKRNLSYNNCENSLKRWLYATGNVFLLSIFQTCNTGLASQPLCLQHFFVLRVGMTSRSSGHLCNRSPTYDCLDANWFSEWPSMSLCWRTWFHILWMKRLMNTKTCQIRIAVLRAELLKPSLRE